MPQLYKTGILSLQFKDSVIVVIPKPNKADHFKANSHGPTVMLNCLIQLIEKVLANQRQYEAQADGLVSQYSLRCLNASRNIFSRL
jgi:hypothetical protein